jgi:Uma2 family endonuclease
MSIATPDKTVQEFSEPPLVLISEDGIPLESDWHRLAMTLLIELVSQRLKGRQDYFVGGNMFIYFSKEQARNRDFRGPDFFFLWDAPLNPPRDYWVVWEEDDKYPDLIIELSSPSTADVDLGIKKDTYEKVFHTREYYVYDPFEKKLRGWRLDDHLRYQEIQPNEKSWLWCDVLQLWLGTWEGEYQGKPNVYLRFYDKQGKLIPSADERALMEKIHAAQEKKRADTERQLKDQEKQRADEERQQKEKERQRADEERQQKEKERQRADEERQQKEKEKQRADEEKRRADEERQRAAEAQGRADEEKKRADEEKKRADDAQRRADAAEAELKQFKARKKKPKL